MHPAAVWWGARHPQFRRFGISTRPTAHDVWRPGLLYPTLLEKAAALGFSLIQNHPFVDGNKRPAHAAMETCLVLNGYRIDATVEEQEDIILKVAAGKSGRKAFTEWLRQHLPSMP